MGRSVDLYMIILILSLTGSIHSYLHDKPLYDDLKNIMPFEPVRYSPANISNAYRVTSKFNPKGMGHLYLVTNLFMDYLQPGEPLPYGFLRIQDGKVQEPDIKTEWPKLVRHYPYTLILAIIGLLFAILMPFAGFIFCCCRCAGKCGSRPQSYNKKHDGCKRVSLGIIISGFAIIMLFGVVCAFVTNQYLEEGIQELPRNARTGLSDVELYLTNTKEEVNNLLVKNYGELQIALNDILVASGQIVKEKLAEVSKAIALNNLTSIVSGLGRIKQDLFDIQKVTLSLQGNATLLQKSLNLVRTRLHERLEKCQDQCREILAEYNINGLSVKNDFSKLPNVTNSLNNLAALLDKNIETEVLIGKKSFDDIQLRIQQSVNTTIPAIQDAIRNAGRGCEKTSQEIIAILDQVSQKIPKYANPGVRKSEEYISQYSEYRYYIDTTASTLLLIILACITFGLLYGFCGKKPDVYGDDSCCNKGTGARYLMAGVYLMFLFAAVLAVVGVAHLLIGVVAEKYVCESLQKPEYNNQLLALADQLIDLKELYPKNSQVDVKLSHIIRTCHRNGSIYEVLGLENVVNVSEVTEYQVRYGIVKKLDALENQIRLNNKVTILTKDAKKQLGDLADSPLSDIDFTAYNDVIENQITSIDLNKLVAVLRETQTKMSPENKHIATELEIDAMILESSQKSIVEKMANLAKELRVKRTRLQEDLKFNHSSLREAIHSLIRDVESAQTYLAQKGPDEVIELSRMFVAEFTRHIDEYLARVVKLTKSSIGKCWPISQVYNATIISTCHKIIYPFNGFWASIGWSLALFVPAIIFCVHLSSLYNKAENAYMQPSGDSEYLYDAYADRDNIPLAKMRDKKRNRGSYDNHQGGQSGYMADNYSGGGGGGGGGGSGHEALVSGRSRRPASTDGARFRDAAPKNWDFPAGGPPGYRNPPTEYERPPPYYYPGPGVAVASSVPPTQHRRSGEIIGSTSSSNSSNNGGGPTVFTYQKLEALENRLYRGGASFIPASTWRRQHKNRISRSRN